MPSFKKVVLLFLALVVMGLVKLPFEQAYHKQLRSRGIIPPALSVEKWNRMGQTGLAGVLGGLRSVFAVAFSLKAHTHFANQEWYELKKDYELITALDPKNPFYWNNGGWHLAYNAASWARMDPDLRPVQREAVEREYLEKGDAFFQEGLTHLPNDIDLWAQIGNMWSSPFKKPDYPRAALAWKEAAERGNNGIYQRRYFYTLGQIRGREHEALAYANKMLKDDSRHVRFPTFRTLYWCLSQLPGVPVQLSLEKIFGSHEQAYRELYNYRFRVQKEGFYGEPLDDTLRQLIQELNVPFKLDPFLNPRKQRLTSKEWNRIMQ